MMAGIRWTASAPAIRRLLLTAVTLSSLMLPAGPAPGAQSRLQVSAHRAQAVSPLSTHVILISVDGLRSDYLHEKHKGELPLPTLRALHARGAQTHGIESVYPSLSLPAHASILTGMLPADHGITSDSTAQGKALSKGDETFQSAREIRGETILNAAQRAGLVADAVAFPLINSNPGDENPDGRSDSKKKRKARLELASVADEAAAGKAAAIIEKERPGLLLLSLSSLDEAHHQFGPFSRESNITLARIDSLVRKIVEAGDRAGITGDTTFLIVAPYGSARVENEFRPNAVLAEKKLLVTNGEGKITSWQALAQPLGGAAAVFIRDPGDEVTARAAEAAFREYFARPHSPIWRIITRHELSRLGADPRAAFYLEAAPMYVMSARAGDDDKSGTDERGAHGFLPQRFEMRGAFIASGRAIRPAGRVEFARLIDLAPTLARLLGFEMKATRGRVIAEMLIQ